MYCGYGICMNHMTFSLQPTQGYHSRQCYLMCTQDCRTWLWGGKGDPTYDGEGQCACVCDDERWSDHNLLGRASCVPVMAHVIFGWAGLALSLAGLCHASYHLNRQVRQPVCQNPSFIFLIHQSKYRTLFELPEPSALFRSPTHT